MIAIIVDGPSRCGSAWPPSPVRCWSSVAVLVLAALGAERIDVLWVGKAGTFGLMFAYPAFLLGHGPARWQHARSTSSPGWSAVPGLVLAWIAAAAYVPVAAPAGPRRHGSGRRARTGPAAGADARRVRSADAAVKAVIMAGGEGTRLRPLTSNQPKPMLPMANRPMMEHVVDLLRQHGFDDIVVTVAFMANAIRTYFGDGSEFGVRMVYATEETPLGTAGSVRNARDELDERFLVISGDVLTDIDLTRARRLPRAKGALATIALKPVENPLEFGIVITREDGSIERFLEKPTWGQVFSDTINTGIYVLEPEIFDYIARGPAGRLLRARSSRPCSRPGRPLYGYVAERLLGGRRHPRGLPAGPTRTSSTARSRVEIDGFPLRPGVWLGKGPSRPDAPWSRARPSSATTAASAPGAASASTRCSGPTSGSATTPSSSAPSSTTTAYLGAGRARSTGASSAGRATCARGSAARRASSSATSACRRAAP